MSKILFIEDDGPLTVILREILTAEGFEVEVAADGQVGLDSALRKDFDLILLDVMLPKKDGYTVCRELRQAGNRTPIVMLTERREEIDEILGLEHGADDYLKKPFSSRVLIARINKRLPQNGSDLLTFGDCEVDLTRAELRKGGSTVPITNREFKLLVTFLKNPGKVLSRDRLLDLVWGMDKFPNDHAVDNHIMNLRRKIEADHHNPIFLVNVPGRGYRFDKKLDLNKF